MFEHRRAPLAPRGVFVRRLVRHGFIASGVIAMSLAIGALGYHAFEGLSWLEATLNAAMILGGMGPVDQLQTTGGKVFAICYALYSGVAFLTIVAVLMAPVAHRFLHRFHLELKDKNP
ncbi:MAG: hypothetical protein NTU94_15975 [Planctomycetota bacterium]|nr:hypothetical protein [Planctomycetota bacterium]